jgi:hypothetical protein
MHKHSINSCKIFLKEVGYDLGLAFVSKASLGLFWTLVQALSTPRSARPRQLPRLLLPIRAYSYRREFLCNGCICNNYLVNLIKLITRQCMTNRECMVGHIHLDNNISNIFFLLKQVMVLERLKT